MNMYVEYLFNAYNKNKILLIIVVGFESFIQQRFEKIDLISFITKKMFNNQSTTTMFSKLIAQ